MKKQCFLFSCVLGLLCLPVQVFAEEETPLGKEMEAMNDAYKAFRRETDAGKGAEQARLAQQAVLKAVSELPELVKAMPAGIPKDKAVVSYRKMMGQLYISLCDVEEAFLNGKIDEVAKIVASLKDLKKSGHDKFMEEE